LRRRPDQVARLPATAPDDRSWPLPRPVALKRVELERGSRSSIQSTTVWGEVFVVKNVAPASGCLLLVKTIEEISSKIVHRVLTKRRSFVDGVRVGSPLAIHSTVPD
jgi:hypothetical protein